MATQKHHTRPAPDRAATADAAFASKPARERLILSAAELFAADGFGGVSVRAICKRAGTGINMVNHYFGSKDGLLDAIVERYGVSVYAVPLRLLETPAQSKDDLIARIELIFETTLEACLAERDVMMVVLQQQAELPPLVAFQSRFVAFLEAAKGEGLVRANLDTAMISGAMLDRIVSQVQFMPWIARTSGVNIATDAEYRHRWSKSSVDLFLNGMLA